MGCIFTVRAKICKQMKNNNSHRDQSISTTYSKHHQMWYLLPQMTKMKWLKISLGVAFVTFICPALSNYALFQIAIALAITLGSMTPLYALILEWIWKAKRPTMKGIVGA